jgi:hypothetical protein
VMMHPRHCCKYQKNLLVRNEPNLSL